jgi:hypothetical protein
MYVRRARRQPIGPTYTTFGRAIRELRARRVATSDEHTHLTTGARGTVDVVDGFGPSTSPGTTAPSSASCTESTSTR